MRFRKWLMETPFNYLSIGHGEHGYDAWVLPRKRDNIIVSSEVAPDDDPEFFHDDYPRFDYKGRIDHVKRQVSITIGEGDKALLEWCVDQLRNKFPGYEIWLFGSALGQPRRLA